MAERTMAQALNAALAEALQFEDVVLLGEDVGTTGGVFRVTDGLQKTFGENRVIDTPVAESGIVGAAFGMAIASFGGALGQGKAISTAVDGIARNPGAQNKIFIPMIVGLALIESLVLLSFVVANGIAGKL